MNRFNVIGGLPRSGSTLLSNILNEHPEVFVSDTSPVAVGTLAAINSTVARPEYLSEVANNAAATEERLIRSARGFVSGWYSVKDEPIIFDKDRSNVWIENYDSFKKIFPNGRIILIVRDPRDIFASILSKRQDNPFAWNANHEKRSLISQVDSLFSPTGLIGSAIMATENILQVNSVTPEQTNHIIFLRYEYLAQNPKESLEGIYSLIGCKQYEHDFNDVSKLATDRDELYGNYWPHEGSGKVEFKPEPWREIVPVAIADYILTKSPMFCNHFNYIKTSPSEEPKSEE